MLIREPRERERLLIKRRGSAGAGARGWFFSPIWEKGKAGARRWLWQGCGRMLGDPSPAPRVLPGLPSGWRCPSGQDSGWWDHLLSSPLGRVLRGIVGTRCSAVCSARVTILQCLHDLVSTGRTRQCTPLRGDWPGWVQPASPGRQKLLCAPFWGLLETLHPKELLYVRL